MRGLLKKDLYFLENSLKMILLAMVVIGVGLSFFLDTSIFIIIFPAILGSTILSTIPKDKNTKWDKFIAMTPIRKDSLFTSKYIMYLILVFLGLFIGIGLVLVYGLINGKINYINLFSSLGLSLAVSFLAGSISLPINFLWTEEKAIAGQIASYSCVALLLVVLLYVINYFLPIKDNLLIVMSSLAIISLLIFIGSWIVGKNKVMELEYQ